MTDAYEFLAARFGGPESKLIVEVGAHEGDDTARLAAFPGVEVHAFEPNPRCKFPSLANASFNRCAVASASGPRQFTPSVRRGPHDWTCSGSLLRPSGHLEAYPDVSFGEPFTVQTITLDEYAPIASRTVDLLWLDVQGAEGEVLRGGKRTIERTRLVYLEYADRPMYAGQAGLVELHSLLPGFALVRTWPSNAEGNALFARVP